MWFSKEKGKKMFRGGGGDGWERQQQQQPSESATRAFYRVNAGELAKLCGVSSYEELLVALQDSGQPFVVSGETAAQVEHRRKKQVKRDAEALRKWVENFREERSRKAPRTNVAVVSTASRPGPLDRPSRPKALLRVGEATLLTHCLRGVCAAGVKHVVLVLGGATSDAISRHVADQEWSSYFTTLRLVDLGKEYASGHAASLLAAARVLLGPTQVPRPFLLVGVDHVYDHELLRRLVETNLDDDQEETGNKLKTAGVCVVETREDRIAQLRLATHLTAVRCNVVKCADPTKEKDDDDSDFMTRPWIREIGRDLERWNAVEAGAFVLTPRVFDALTKLARAAPYFTLSEALGHFCGKNQTSTLKAMHTSGLPWIAVETEQQQHDAAVVGSPLFTFTSRPSLQKPHVPLTRGVAVAVEVCHSDDRTGVFKTVDDDIQKEGVSKLLGIEDDDEEKVAAGIEETPKHLIQEQQEEEKIALVEPTTKELATAPPPKRKVSSGSLAALLETYDHERDKDEEEDKEEDKIILEEKKKKKKKEEQQPVDMFLAFSEDRGQAALAAFVESSSSDSSSEDYDSDDRGPVEEGEDSIELGTRRRRQKKGLTFSETAEDDDDVPHQREAVAFPSVVRRHGALAFRDIERVRLRLFTDSRHQPSLAVRVERKVPVIGYAILVTACIACASTSTFERELPPGVSGPMRSVWRQSVTAVMLFVVEIIRQQLQQEKRRVKCLCRRRDGSGKVVTTRRLLHPPVARSMVPYREKEAQRSEAQDLALRRFLFSLLSVEVDTDFLGVLLRLIAGYAVQNIALCVAFLFVPTPVALTLCNATPLWLVLYAGLFLSAESSPKPSVIVGTAVGFFGAVVLCAAELAKKKAPEETDNAQQHKNPLVGMLIGLFGGLGGAVYVTAAKRAKTVPPTRLLLLANVGALLLSALVVYGANPEGVPLMDPVHGLFGWLATRRNFLDSFFLSTVVDGIGIMGILFALRFVDPLVVTVSLQLEPILASVVDAAVGVGTLSALSPATAVGTAIVLIGCTVVVAKSDKSTDDLDASKALEIVMPKDSTSRASSADGSAPTQTPFGPTQTPSLLPTTTSEKPVGYVPVYASTNHYGATSFTSGDMVGDTTSSSRRQQIMRTTPPADEDYAPFLP